MSLGPEDAELRDAALHDEIELVGELIVAASAVDGPLTPSEIDEALGVAPADAEAVPTGVPESTNG